MKRFSPRPFLQFANIAGMYESAGIFADNFDTPMVGDIRASLSGIVSKMEEGCRELGLVASTATCKKLDTLLESPQVTRRETAKLYLELQGRIDDELEENILISVDPSHANLYTNLQLFGQRVGDAFPSAAIDIEEAGKCLALGRSTAAVFHLMRVLESGLRALGASLGDPTLDANANPTWDRILKRGDIELLKSADKRSREWQAKGEFFTDAIANLRAVKTAWRNPTMHVIGVYDPEKALDVFNTVGALMRHLATELHE
jgi:hypothetical protein